MIICQVLAHFCLHNATENTAVSTLDDGERRRATKTA
jgi:hypothetical protein